jgi:hypothetical protein
MLSVGDDILKKMTFPSQGVSAAAGGGLAVSLFASASQVQSLPATEWASYAARYQQYRVKSVRIVWTPVYNVSTSTIFDSPIYFADAIGTSAPTTVAQVLADERAVIKEIMKRFEFIATSARNPNMSLWNPTNAALPVANNVSIYGAMDNNVGATQRLCSYNTEWLVEFRGSQ